MTTKEELQAIEDQFLAMNKNDDIVPPRWYGFAHPFGWGKIVLDLYNAIEEIAPGHKVLQVKEKFGGLRYYCESDVREDVSALIDEAEKKAADTCQICGNSPAETMANPRGWVVCVCMDHKAPVEAGTPVWQIDESKE